MKPLPSAERGPGVIPIALINKSMKKLTQGKVGENRPSITTPR